MATLGSAKSNVMKSVIPAVKKCLLPAGRPGDSFVSLMCRSLSTDAAKNRPEGDSSIEDDRESRRVWENRRGGFFDVLHGPSYPLRSIGFGIDHLTEDKDALYLQVDLPGLGEEDFNIDLNPQYNELVIKGKCLADAEFKACGRIYSRRIELPPIVYRSGFRARMKNGVLHLIIPKFTIE